MYELGLEDLAASFHMIHFVWFVVKVLESSIVLVHKVQLKNENILKVLFQWLFIFS